MCERNRMIARIGCFFILLLALQIPNAALAHEGPPRIELNTQQTSSGAELEIRGINIAPEQPITLSLVGNGAEFALGTAVGDVHGDFVMGVRLPAEALAGAYRVRAFGANRLMVSTPLTLLGAAAEEEGAQREQDEPLLAPMPRAQPASPAGAATAGGVPAPAATQASQFVPWMAVVLAALAATVGLAIVARRRAANLLK
jgi:hypothetical protein